MANEVVLSNGKKVAIVNPKLDLDIASRKTGGKYHITSKQLKTLGLMFGSEPLHNPLTAISPVDGSLYLCGAAASVSPINYLTKLDIDGSIIWSKRISWGSNATVIRKIAVDNAGHVILGGQVLRSGNYDCLVLKVSSAGSILWQRCIYYASLYDAVFDIALDSTNAVICVGYDGSSPTRGLIFKLSSIGNILWQRTHNVGGAANSTALHKVFVDHLNNYYVVGQALNRLVVIKVNSSGDVLTTNGYSIGGQGLSSGSASIKGNVLYLCGQQAGTLYVFGVSLDTGAHLTETQALTNLNVVNMLELSDGFILYSPSKGYIVKLKASLAIEWQIELAGLRGHNLSIQGDNVVAVVADTPKTGLVRLPLDGAGADNLRPTLEVTQTVAAGGSRTTYGVTVTNSTLTVQTSSFIIQDYPLTLV